MTAEYLSIAAGALLSLGFSYIPKLRDWYDTQAPDGKRFVMLAALFLVAAVIFAAGCLGYADGLGLPALTCDEPGFLSLLRILWTAVVANQVTFLLTPKTKK